MQILNKRENVKFIRIYFTVQSKRNFHLKLGLYMIHFLILT